MSGVCSRRIEDPKHIKVIACDYVHCDENFRHSGVTAHGAFAPFRIICNLSYNQACCIARLTPVAFIIYSNCFSKTQNLRNLPGAIRGFLDLALLTYHKHSEVLGFLPKETTMAKYDDVTVEQIEACINRMGGWNNFLSFIGGNGRIVFDSVVEPISFTSNGLSGEEWI
jgi:hypothetical protein